MLVVKRISLPGAVAERAETIRRPPSAPRLALDDQVARAGVDDDDGVVTLRPPLRRADVDGQDVPVVVADERARIGRHEGTGLVLEAVGDLDALADVGHRLANGAVDDRVDAHHVHHARDVPDERGQRTAMSIMATVMAAAAHFRVHGARSVMEYTTPTYADDPAPPRLDVSRSS